MNFFKNTTTHNMQKIFLRFCFFVLLAVAATACNNSKKEGDAALNDKRSRLEKLKKEKSAKDKEILDLQTELSKLDTSSSNPGKIKLVALAPVTIQNFDHYIQLQGRIDAENSSYIAPRGMGGVVKQLYVRQGDQVRKGQLLLRLDNAVQQQQVAAIKQQSAGIKTQLALAKSLYERQKNLWEKGIGTEVQLLTAQTNVTALQNQLSQLAAQVAVAQEQLNSANVYSDANGVANEVNVRVGEIFTGGPQIKIVNTSSLKVISTIPENYLGTVSRGTAVVISMPDINKTYNSTVSFIGASIDPLSRGFAVEAKLPSDAALKPNQLALLKIRDYSAVNTIAIPLKTLQNDEDGKFVMVARDSNGKLIASKRAVSVGSINDDLIEIKSGLKAGDKLVTEGYAGLYEGQQLKTSL